MIVTLASRKTGRSVCWAFSTDMTGASWATLVLAAPASSVQLPTSRHLIALECRTALQI